MRGRLVYWSAKGCIICAPGNWASGGTPLFARTQRRHELLLSEAVCAGRDREGPFENQKSSRKAVFAFSVLCSVESERFCQPINKKKAPLRFSQDRLRALAALAASTGRFQNANQRNGLHLASRTREDCLCFLARLSAIHACMKPNWTCCFRTLSSVFEIFIGVVHNCCR